MCIRFELYVIVVVVVVIIIIVICDYYDHSRTSIHFYTVYVNTQLSSSANWYAILHCRLLLIRYKRTQDDRRDNT